MKRRKSHTKIRRLRRKRLLVQLSRSKRPGVKPARKTKRSSVRRSVRYEARHTRRVHGSLKRRSLQAKRRRRRSRRRMVTFSNGQRHLVVLSRRMAGTNGRYLNAVRRLLHTNDPTALAEFAGQSIKDIHGHEFPLETLANALYRANSVPEPIAEIYQVLT